MFVHKIDEELELKLPQKHDAEALFRLTDQSRSHLKEWLPWLDFTTKEEDTKNFIAGSNKLYADNQGLNALIFFKGELAGVAGYNQLDWTNKTAKVGYWLGVGFQGHGIMTRTAQALTQYAFEELNMNRVEIRAAAGNKKSRAIPERLGYTYEGQIRQAEWLYDHYVDHVMYGMLSDEWKNR
ncbi:GNAT family N-acetyltransferase [Jeotgalibacillus campisalis]|uniref:GCN5 family acetyltransferase n=1 Tax=Jeotgalibacillus campisalis TaxID=220754 RepID=A0A0C2W522_9BACL|nr:GNAT family protein [Jeotgalibacillus campisalis]KIL51113.1 GCN5 family acetyltransferase [Jeotgalibacillus campisalis]